MFLRNVGVGVVCIRGAYIRNIYVRGICAKNAFSAIDGYIKDIDPKSICDPAYKPSKSFIKGLKLLIKSISEIFTSFCLYL